MQFDDIKSFRFSWKNAWFAICSHCNQHSFLFSLWKFIPMNKNEERKKTLKKYRSRLESCNIATSQLNCINVYRAHSLLFINKLDIKLLCLRLFVCVCVLCFYVIQTHFYSTRTNSSVHQICEQNFWSFWFTPDGNRCLYVCMSAFYKNAGSFSPFCLSRFICVSIQSAEKKCYYQKHQLPFCYSTVQLNIAQRKCNALQMHTQLKVQVFFCRLCSSIYIFWDDAKHQCDDFSLKDLRNFYESNRKTTKNHIAIRLQSKTPSTSARRYKKNLIPLPVFIVHCHVHCSLNFVEWQTDSWDFSHFRNQFSNKSDLLE